MQLKGRQDKFRLLLPESFIPEEINDKYAKVLQRRHSFIYKPIDFLNESIQKIQVLGFNSGVVSQMQTKRGGRTVAGSTAGNPNMLQSLAETPYRSPAGPMSLIDKTLNVDFRHGAGFLNYFLVFESFWYHYARETASQSLPDMFPIEIFNERGETQARLLLFDPVIEGMDMLDLDFTQPIAQSQTFRVIFKWSTMDVEFIDYDVVTYEEIDNPLTKDDYEPAKELILPEGLEMNTQNDN